MAASSLAPTPRSLPVAERIVVIENALRDLGDLAEVLAELSRDSRHDREPQECWLDLTECVGRLDQALAAGHRALETFRYGT